MRHFLTIQVLILILTSASVLRCTIVDSEICRSAREGETSSKESVNPIVWEWESVLQRSGKSWHCWWGRTGLVTTGAWWSEAIWHFGGFFVIERYRERCKRPLNLLTGCWVGRLVGVLGFNGFDWWMWRWEMGIGLSGGLGRGLDWGKKRRDGRL